MSACSVFLYALICVCNFARADLVGESLAAVLAAEGLLSRVRSHVPNHVTRAGETFVADFAEVLLALVIGDARLVHGLPRRRRRLRRLELFLLLLLRLPLLLLL